MIVEVMSEAELRLWLRRYIKRGKGKHVGLDKQDREFPVLALCRSIEMDHRFFFAWLNEKSSLPERFQRALSRIARAWDAGLIEFGKEGQKRFLIHRETPRHMPARLKFELRQGNYPKLTVTGRPVAGRIDRKS